MKCKHCGAELEPASRFCPGCGEAAEQTEASPTEAREEYPAWESELEAAPQEEAQDDAGFRHVQEEPPRKKGIGKRAVAAVIALCLLGGAILGVYTYLNRDGEEPPADDPVLSSTDPVTLNPEADLHSTVVQLRDLTLSNRELSYYYWDMYYYVGYMFGNMLDLSVPLTEQQFSDEESWHDVFLRLALDNWVQTKIVLELGLKEGFEMDATYQENYDTVAETIDQDAVDQGYESGDEFIRDNFGDFSDVESYLAYLWDAYYMASYTSAKYNEILTRLQSEPVTSFEETVNVRHILVPFETENAQTVAQELYDAWLAVGTEEEFAALAGEHSTDGGSSANGGLYENVTAGTMVDTFNDWIFDPARQTGDSGIVETNYGYHIMYYSGAGEPVPASVEAIADEEYNAWMTGLTADVEHTSYPENVLIGGNLFTRASDPNAGTDPSTGTEGE